jgi:hypothetical protein
VSLFVEIFQGVYMSEGEPVSLPTLNTLPDEEHESHNVFLVWLRVILSPIISSRVILSSVISSRVISFRVVSSRSFCPRSLRRSVISSWGHFVA